MHAVLLFVTMVLGSGIAVRAHAAQPASPELCRAKISCEPRLWTQETLTLRPKSGGEPYVIELSIPSGPIPTDGFPVVYLLDAGTTFGTLADIAHYQALFFTPVVVVGIRYPDPFEVGRRGDDLASPAADAFLDFLVGEVRGEVTKRTRIDRSRQALFGHSLSGYFALRTALSQPHAFDTYVIGDPSIQIGDWRIVKQLPEFSARNYPSVPRRLLFTKGTDSGAEEMRFARKVGIPQPPPRTPGAFEISLREFVEMLRPIKGIDVTYVEFPGETHQSMIPAHLGRGMRWTLLSWDPP